jgi:phenylacetate-CoA ligase
MDDSWFRIYGRMPIWAQNVACSFAGIEMRQTRYNKTFHKALRLLERSQWWSLEELRCYQNKQLQRMIKHAYDTVPYYRRIFDDRKLTPNDIRTVDDLPKLPILEKKTVRECFTDLQSKGWPKKRIVHGHTGGTTGTALDLTSDIDTQPWQWAIWWRHRHRFGLKLNDPFIVFAGRSVVPMDTMAPPFWRRNFPMHQTYVSVHHMTKHNMPILVDYLQKRQVVYYSGYPSALYLLASYLLQNGITLKHPPKVTVSGAETVLPHQRTAIMQAFQTQLADQYGASEQCGNISECEKHTYHVDMEFGVVEFLPLDGAPANVRRIVCTGFNNPVMPFIRYNIGDLATIGDNQCPCGRVSPTVERIDGRIESYIITPDGRQLGRLDFPFKTTTSIEEAQFIQDMLDHVTVKVVRNDTYTREDEVKLRNNLRVYLGDQIRIDIEYVKEIPREPNGKFRQIVSSVSPGPSVWGGKM